MKFIHLSSLLLYFVTEDLANTLGQIKSKLQREDIYFLLGFVVWREAVSPCHRRPQNPQIRGDGWPSDGTASHAISSAGEKCFVNNCEKYLSSESLNLRAGRENISLLLEWVLISHGHVGI